MLMCKVQNNRSMYSSDIFAKMKAFKVSSGDAKIQKDLKRTCPGVEEFELPSESGQNRLYNVLKAYQSFDPETGYC